MFDMVHELTVGGIEPNQTKPHLSGANDVSLIFTGESDQSLYLYLTLLAPTISKLKFFDFGDPVKQGGVWGVGLFSESHPLF